jgi:hypothetical protein
MQRITCNATVNYPFTKLLEIFHCYRNGKLINDDKGRYNLLVATNKKKRTELNISEYSAQSTIREAF